MPYSVLMPVFARKILHGGPITLGLLMAAAGFGALTGAIYLASRKNVRGLTKIIPLSTALFGIGLITFSFSRDTVAFPAPDVHNGSWNDGANGRKQYNHPNYR